MRIEDMRSGTVHLKKHLESASAPPGVFDREEEDIQLEIAEPPLRAEDPNELDQPVWSVVSFEKVEAASMTHSRAVAFLEELERKNVSGLCLMTDAAARRVRKS